MRTAVYVVISSLLFWVWNYYFHKIAKAVWLTPTRANRCACDLGELKGGRKFRWYGLPAAVMATVGVILALFIAKRIADVLNLPAWAFKAFSVVAWCEVLINAALDNYAVSYTAKRSEPPDHLMLALAFAIKLMGLFNLLVLAATAIVFSTHPALNK